MEALEHTLLVEHLRANKKEIQKAITLLLASAVANPHEEHQSVNPFILFRFYVMIEEL
ncbi:MAG: hypothetical protein RLZZ420_1258 [Bacteroidota bacterium]|jgi:hypothetical protein